jgi:hypothetical protein
VNTPEGPVLRNFENEKIGPASEKDLERFDYELSVSPIKFVYAMRALHRLEGDASDYEAIAYLHVLRNSVLSDAPV